MLIRKANREDIRVMAAMGEMMHHEGRHARYEFDMAKALEFGERNIDSPGILFLIAEEGMAAAPVGFFIGMISEFPFEKATMACDMLTFVLPGARGAEIGAGLIEKFEEWATEWGVDEIHLGESVKIAPEAADKLYRKMGYEPLSTSYAKVLER